MVIMKLKKIILCITILILSLFANVAIKVVPFKKLIKAITNSDEYVENGLLDQQKRRLFHIVDCLLKISTKVPWRVKCFEQAIIVLVFAKLLKINMCISFGIYKNESGDYLTHAWTESGGFSITGGENRHLFKKIYMRSYIVS